MIVIDKGPNKGLLFDPNTGLNLGHPVGGVSCPEFLPPQIHQTTRWLHYKSRHTMAPSHSGFFLFNHYNLQGSCLQTVIQPLAETADLLISIPISTDQQGGVCFQPTPMGKITRTHSPRTGVESSKTYPRVRIFAYSPRTGTRSKCLQNPWGVTLEMEPNHLRRLQDAVGFSFLTTTNQQIPTGTTYTGLIFS